MAAATTTTPVTVDRLPDLTDLFETHNTTKGCFCTYFFVPQKEYHAGWSGGNRAAFELFASETDVPVGVLAYEADVPVGWCAVGPRIRYPRTISPRAKILRDRDPAEDTDVWLVSCFFVRKGHRGKGLTKVLLDAAVNLAAAHDATAVEGFPLTASGTVDEYLGREELFAACGFRAIAHPSPRRVVMRRELP